MKPKTWGRCTSYVALQVPPLTYTWSGVFTQNPVSHSSLLMWERAVLFGGLKKKKKLQPTELKTEQRREVPRRGAARHVWSLPVWVCTSKLMGASVFDVLRMALARFGLDTSARCTDCTVMKLCVMFWTLHLSFLGQLVNVEHQAVLYLSSSFSGGKLRVNITHRLMLQFAGEKKKMLPLEDICLDSMLILNKLIATVSSLG